MCDIQGLRLIVSSNKFIKCKTFSDIIMFFHNLLAIILHFILRQKLKEASYHVFTTEAYLIK